MSYAGESADLGKVLLAARTLDKLLGRKTRDFDPIGSESAKVIARRLFGTVDAAAAADAAKAYDALYARVADEQPGSLAARARTGEYDKRILDNLTMHKAKDVRAWVAAPPELIANHCLSPCAPELNPDEYLNGDFKPQVARCAPSRDR